MVTVLPIPSGLGNDPPIVKGLDPLGIANVLLPVFTDHSTVLSHPKGVEFIVGRPSTHFGHIA
jgi:hypothetical protein